MKNLITSSRFATALTASAMILFTGHSAQAANGADTWTGATNNAWASANWSGANSVPISGDTLVFGTAGTSGTSLNNNLTSSAFNIAGITFSAGGSAYSITGNTFNLSATTAITNNSSYLQSLSATGGFTNSTGSTFTVNSTGGNIYINALTDSSNAAQTTTVNGAGGTLILGSFTANSGAGSTSDAFAGTGNVTIQGGVSNGGAGTNAFGYQGTGTLSLLGASTYKGATTLTSGTTDFANESALYNDATGSWTAPNIIVKTGATAVFAVGGSGSGYFTTSDIGTLLTNLDGAISSNGLEGGSSFGIDTTNASGGTFTLSNNLANTTGTLSGTVGLTKIGSGTLVVSGTNTNTGASTFLGGSVVLNYGTTGNQISTGSLTLGSNLILSGGSNKSETVGNTVLPGVAGVSYVSSISAQAGSGDTINLGTFGAGNGLSVINFQPGVAFSTTGSGGIGAVNTGFTGIYGGFAVAGNGITEDFAANLTSTATNSAIVALPFYDYAIGSTNSSYVRLIANAGGANLTDGSGNYNSVKFDTSNSTAAGTFGVNKANAFFDNDGNLADKSFNLLFTGIGALTINGDPLVHNTNTSANVNGITYLQDYSTGTVTIASDIYGTGAFTGSGTGVNNVTQVTGASAGTLIKAGPGTVVLSGINNYVGNTYIDGGTLSISTDSNLGGVSGTLTVTAASTGTSVTVTGVPVSQTLVGASFLGTTITNQSASVSGVVTLTLASSVTASTGSFSYANGQQTIGLDGGTLQSTATGTTPLILGETNGTLSNYRSITIGPNGGTIDVTGTGTLTAPGVISSAAGTGATGGSLTKIDSGTLVLANSNTYAGTAVNGGTLKLDFAATGISNFSSPANNILLSTGALSLGGGTLSINGAASAIANSQTLASLALTGGSSAIALTQNGASSVGLTFTNGSLTRTAGSTVDFNPAANTSITLAGNTSNGFLGNYAFFGTGATEGYAATDVNGVVQASATTAAPQASNFSSATTNYTYTAGGATDSSISTNGNATANTVAFNTSAAQTIALGANTLTLNGFLNNGGALTISGTGAVTTGSSTDLVIGGASNVNISAPITGAGGLTDSNTGTVALSGVNTFTGPTTVNSGVLGLTGGSVTGSNITTGGGGIVTQSAGNVIAGATATFTQGSTGTSTLAGANTYGGLTTVSNGELDLNNSTGQAIAGNVAVSGGALKLQAASQINAASSLAVSGGTFNLQTFNQTLNGVQLTGGMIAGTTGTLTSTTAFDIQNGAATAILGGTAGLTKSTAGVALLSGANTYSGTTAINAGTLNFSALNNLGSSTSAISLGGGDLSYTGANLSFTRGFAMTSSSEIDSSSNGTLTVATVGISGSGTLTVGGTGSMVVSSAITTGTGGLNVNQFGTLTLSGANTFTGVTAINNGILNLGSAGALGGGGTINFNGGTLQFSAANTSDVSSRITSTATGPVAIDTNGQSVFFASGIGSGAIDGLTKAGTGTLFLNGADSYTGTTVVNAGTLVLNGANTTTGATTVSTGTLTAGNATALGTGAVTVAAGATLNYFNNTDAQLALSSMAITGTTTATIGGTLGSTATSSEIKVTGAATSTATAVKVNLYANSALNASPAGTYTLLAGNGSSTLTNATYSLGTVYNDTDFTAATPTATASALTVVLSNATAITNAYWVGNFTGATNVWAASNGSTTSNWSTTLGSVTNTGVVPGAGANVFISDTGAIALAPTATVLGANMTIASLTIQDAVNAFGLVADGNTLTIATSSGITQTSTAKAGSIAANVALGTSQTWTNNSANTLTVSGNISGSGMALTTTGTGKILLSGTNTYSGGTNLNGGTLSLGSTGAIGTTGTISFGGGTLQYNTGVATDFSSRFSTGNGQVYSFDTNGQTVTVGTALTSSGGTLALKDSAGTGTLILGGNNTFSGGVTINSGTLQLGNAGALNSTAGAQNTVTFGASSTGALALAGNSVTVASLNTNATAGTPKVENANGAAVANATLTVGNASNLNSTYAGAIQDGTGGGTLALVAASTGTLALNGANTFTGGVTINAGTLQVGSASALNNTAGSQNTVAFGAATTGTLALNGNNTTVGSLTTNAGNAGSTIVENGDSSTTTSSNTLTVGNSKNFSGTYAGTIQDGAGGTLALATAGQGTLTLTNTNTYSGGTTIGAGSTLVIGNANALSTGTITLSGGYLAATQAVTLANSIVQSFGTNPGVSGSNTITSTGGLTFNGTTGTPSVFLNKMSGGARFIETGTTSLANNASAIGEVIFGGSGNTSLDTIVGGANGNTSIGSLLNYYGTGTLTLNGLNFSTGTEDFIGGTVVLNENGDGAGYLLGLSNNLVLGSNLVISGGSGVQENVASFGVSTNTGVSNAATISAAAGSTSTINLGNINDGNLLGVVNFQPGVASTTTSSGILGATGLGNTGVFGGWALAGNGVTEDFATSLNPVAGTNAAIVALPSYDYAIGGRNTSFVESILNAGGQSQADSSNANWGAIKFDTSNTTAAGSYAFNRSAVLANFFGAESLLFTGIGNLTLSGNSMVQEENLDGNDTGIIYLQQYGSGTVTIANNLYGNTGVGLATAGGAVGEAFGGSGGALIKSGPGTLVLTGTNNYVGNTYVDGGTLSISTDSNLGGVSGSLTVTAITTGTNTVTVTGVPTSQTLVGATFLGQTITSQSVSSTPGVAGGTVTLTLSGNVSATTGTFSYANGQQNIELNGGTLQSTASNLVLGETNGTVSNNRTITLGANGGTLDVTGANTLIVGGVISGAGGTGTLSNGTLTKVDSGTLVLAGANTNTGGTFVNGGTLKLDFAGTGLSNFTSPTTNILAATGSLTLGGGTLAINGAATSVANTQTIGSLALSGGSNIVALTQNGATSVGLTVTNGNNVTRVTGSTIDYNPGTGTSITLAVNVSNAFLGNYAFFGTGATEGYAATSSTGVVQAAATTVATQASNFNNAATNYTYGGAGGTTDSSIAGSATANTVAFDTTGAQTIALGANTLTLNGLLNNGGALTISGTTGALAIGSSNELVLGGASNVSVSAPITGAGALTDSNSGTVTLSGANTYAGPTTVNTGILALTGGSLASSSVTTAGTGVVTQSAGNVISGASTTFTQGSTGTSTLAGTNTYGGLTTVKNGELDLNNATGQAIAGNVAVSGGAAVLQHSSQINAASSLAVSGGTFNLQGNNQTLAGVQLTGGTIAGTGTLTSNSAFDVQNGVASAVLAGSAGLTKSNGGVVLLSGANTYTGTTAINGGIVEISALNNLGADTSAVTLGGGTLSYTGSSPVTFARGFNLTANSEIDASSAGAFTNSGAIAGNGSNLTVGGSGSTTLSGNVTGVGNLNVNQFGTLTLSGANTFSGLTTINNGTLALGSAGALGGTTGITFNGGTLQFSANNTSDVSGLIQNSTATGPISIDTNGQSVLFASALSGSNLDGLTKLGAGTLTLSGSNSYAGNTLISAGTVEFTTPTAMTSGTVTANAGTTLAIAAGDPAGSGFSTATSGAGSIGGIFSGVGGQGGSVTLVPTAGTNPVVTGAAVGIDTSLGNVTYSGAITNVGVGVTKLGTNNLNLAGANTYTGATLVNSGGLIVSGSTAAGSAVTINSGGSLLGDSAVNEGTLNGSVTVATGGAINLQDSTVGTLHVGSLTANGGTLSFDLGAGSTGNLDLIADAGTLTIGGNTTITIGFVSGTPSLTTGTYSLITYGGTALSAANFAKLSLSSTTLGAYTLSLVNGATGTSGVELKITAAATPTTYTLTTVAASTLLHAGGSTTLTTTLTNTGSTTMDTITYSGVGASSSGTGSLSAGTPLSGTLVNNNASVSNTSQTLTTTAGTSGTATISSTGTLSNTNAGGTPTGTPTGTSVTVYSGFGTWNTNGNGTWGTTPTATPANWTAAGGTPGVTAGFTGVDTATFGAQTATAITVGLNGAAPNLNAITFSSPTTSYTLAQNISGGTGTTGITLAGTTPSINVTNPLSSATAGTQTISAPISLGATTALNVAANQSLVISNAISSTGAFGLSNSGPGTTILSNAAGNTYTGPTTITGGKFYVNNSTGSGTGSGAVTVGVAATGAANSGTLAGKGSITASTLVVNGGGTLASGDPSQVSGTGLIPDGNGHQVGGMTLANTAVTIGSSLGTAHLAFDLGSGTSGINNSTASGQNDFSNPNNNTTYLKLTGSTTINFAGSTSISLVDLTNTNGSNGTLTLRTGAPYELISAGSDADYLNLVIATGSGTHTTYSLSQTGSSGYVVGVFTGGGTFDSSDINNAGYVTPISIAQYGSDGVTPLTSGPNGAYPVGALYLTGGNLEVVPEPGTWALMLGGLALLIVIQRRRSKA